MTKSIDGRLNNHHTCSCLASIQNAWSYHIILYYINIICLDITKTLKRVEDHDKLSLMHKVLVFQRSMLQIHFGSPAKLVLYFSISDPFCPTEHVCKKASSIPEADRSKLQYIPDQWTWFPCRLFEMELRPWNCSNKAISLLFAILLQWEYLHR